MAGALFCNPPNLPEIQTAFELANVSEKDESKTEATRPPHHYQQAAKILFAT
jgi:hypothetical protein